ncbi:MAG: hypothetical protein AB1679_30345 [Actinomycetota bacterium]|jgi:transcription elongation factor Elf1
MKDVRIDETGDLRCWNCGSKQLRVAFGVGALLTKKKLQCQVCGQYNDARNAKPWNGPESHR